MNTERGFPPVARPDARYLVLGSMPGRKSLAEYQYYAHPRNAFWPITGALFGFDPELPYQQRLVHIQNAGVALWDVIAACARPGSLDANIVNASIKANDFNQFFQDHPGIQFVFFNGQKAQEEWQKRVVPFLPDSRKFVALRLPSSSPAYAAMNFDQKLAEWRKLIIDSNY